MPFAISDLVYLWNLLICPGDVFTVWAFSLSQIDLVPAVSLARGKIFTVVNCRLIAKMLMLQTWRGFWAGGLRTSPHAQTELWQGVIPKQPLKRQICWKLYTDFPKNPGVPCIHNWTGNKRSLRSSSTAGVALCHSNGYNNGREKQTTPTSMQCSLSPTNCPTTKEIKPVTTMQSTCVFQQKKAKTYHAPATSHCHYILSVVNILGTAVHTNKLRTKHLRIRTRDRSQIRAKWMRSPFLN